jgi:hypothetical protein
VADEREADGRGADGRGAELGDAPPFLSWRTIYIIVVAALAADIALGAALTVLYG